MRSAILSGLLLFVCVHTTSAADAPTGPGLSLDQAMVRVLEKNPELQAAAIGSQAMAAQIRAAQQTPAMRVNLGLENFAGSGNYKGSDSLETTLSLSKIFELGNKSALRGEVAQQGYQSFNSEQDAKRLDVMARAAKQFIHVVMDQEHLQVATDKLALLERSYAVIDQRVKAGRSHVAERRRMAIAVARARIELEHAEHELLTSKVKLATLWGETQPDFGRAHAELFAIEQPASFAQLQQQLDHHPQIVRFASEQRLAQARIDLAQAKASTDIELTAGVKHFNAVDDHAFVLSASIPFGLGSRAQPSIDEQQYQAQQLPFDLQQQKLSLFSTLQEVYQELLHSYEATRVFQHEIIPQAEQALREYEQGYAAGRFSFLELSDAQQTLLDARLDAVTSAANYHRFQIEIDRLTARGLVTGAQP